MLRQHEDKIDAEFVIASLEDAAWTMLAMPQSGFSTRLSQGRVDVLQDVQEAYGYSDVRVRRAMPAAAKITAMDVILGWLALLDNVPKRRIVALRALTHPGSGKPKSWRSIAELVGADHKSVQRWHAEAVDQIVQALNRARQPIVPALER